MRNRRNSRLVHALVVNFADSRCARTANLGQSRATDSSLLNHWTKHSQLSTKEESRRTIRYLLTRYIWLYWPLCYASIRISFRLVSSSAHVNNYPSTEEKRPWIACHPTSIQASLLTNPPLQSRQRSLIPPRTMIAKHIPPKPQLPKPSLHISYPEKPHSRRRPSQRTV
jgi:hypothetical protein